MELKLSDNCKEAGALIMVLEGGIDEELENDFRFIQRKIGPPGRIETLDDGELNNWRDYLDDMVLIKSGRMAGDILPDEEVKLGGGWKFEKKIIGNLYIRDDGVNKILEAGGYDKKLFLARAFALNDRAFGDFMKKWGESKYNKIQNNGVCGRNIFVWEDVVLMDIIGTKAFIDNVSYAMVDKMRAGNVFLEDRNCRQSLRADIKKIFSVVLMEDVSNMYADSIFSEEVVVAEMRKILKNLYCIDENRKFPVYLLDDVIGEVYKSNGNMDCVKKNILNKYASGSYRDIKSLLSNMETYSDPKARSRWLQWMGAKIVMEKKLPLDSHFVKKVCGYDQKTDLYVLDDIKNIA